MKANISGKNIDSYDEELLVHRNEFTEFTTRTMMKLSGRSEWFKFMVVYCHHGIMMTEQVSTWIRRSGESTRNIGLEDIGKLLVSHSKHEEGHERLYKEDVNKLCVLHNELFPDDPIELNQISSLPIFSSITDYIALHEQVINGLTPYCQVAIEYEIEKLSVTNGRKFLDQIVKNCGDRILPCLSFLTEHIEIDVWHTQFNRNLLIKLFNVANDAYFPIAKVGKQALKIYANYVQDCYNQASSKLGKATNTR